MNPFLQSLLALSFGIAFIIGFFTKRFLFLLLSVFVAAAINAASIWFYFNFTPPDVGLGIIAIFPVIIIIFSVLHLSAALLGGIIGTIVGKRFRRP